MPLELGTTEGLAAARQGHAFLHSATDRPVCCRCLRRRDAHQHVAEPGKVAVLFLGDRALAPVSVAPRPPRAIAYCPKPKSNDHAAW